jgi:hypothetical protein
MALKLHCAMLDNYLADKILTVLANGPSCGATRKEKLLLARNNDQAATD